MSKKMKVLIAVLVAILTLTVSGAVAVLAQDEDEPEPDEEALIEEQDEVSPKLFAASIGSGELLSRVAEILGITEEELRDAFAQARQEILAERGEKAFYEFLDRAVAEGLITEDEAAEIRAWAGNMPTVLNQLTPKPRIMNAVRGRQMIAVPEGWRGPLPNQNTD